MEDEPAEPKKPRPIALPLAKTERLRDKLAELPSEPGVYFHKDAAGTVIYVGKAANLRNRVKSYFQNRPHDPKTLALIGEIADTDWRVTPSEIDALFLESEMVKRYHPKWNILLQDDKSTIYLRIDLKSAVPYISMTHNPVDDGARYFGPYFGSYAIKKALRILRKIWPFYDRPYSGKKTLYTDLGLTPGLEVGKSAADYKHDLRRLIKFIEGGGVKITRQLTREMQDAAGARNFELAAKIRNQLFHLRELQTQIVFGDTENIDLESDLALRELQELLGLPEPPRRIEGFDISHQSGKYVVASNVVFKNGIASRADYKKFKIREDKNDDFAAMREVISRRLGHLDDWGRPDLVLIDGGPPFLSCLKTPTSPTSDSPNALKRLSCRQHVTRPATHHSSPTLSACHLVRTCSSSSNASVTNPTASPLTTTPFSSVRGCSRKLRASRKRK